MEVGHVDPAIGLLPQLKSGYFQRKLFRQRYVCMFRAGHPLDKGEITRAEFEAADHVQVISGGSGHAIVDQTMERPGYRRNIVLTVPHFVAVGHILAASEMIATVPERYAMACAAPFGLRYVSHPLPVPNINIKLFWHTPFNKDPTNRWLRNLIFTALRTAQAKCKVRGRYYTTEVFSAKISLPRESVRLLLSRPDGDHDELQDDSFLYCAGRRPVRLRFRAKSRRSGPATRAGRSGAGARRRQLSRHGKTVCVPLLARTGGPSARGTWRCPG